ncbi:MAG: TorF family putative porin, partial [Janthinobacterium sp.]
MLGCLFFLAALPAQAQTTDSPAATFSANASLTSQYISRGFRQTWGKPALQAGADYAHPSGWSLGTWASTVSDRYIEDATVEWDVYGGYGGTVGELGYSVL